MDTTCPISGDQVKIGRPKTVTGKCLKCKSNAKSRGYCNLHYMKLYNSKKLKVTKKESHGMHGSVEYYTWLSIRRRCLNKNNPSYPNYGGRGITICDSWLHSFTQFYKDMGARPKSPPRYSLDRIDNDGNYEPGNCRWATYQQQNRNKRVRSDSATGHIGITMTGKKFYAHIKYNFKNINLGTFDNIKDAIAARKRAEDEYHV